VPRPYLSHETLAHAIARSRRKGFAQSEIANRKQHLGDGAQFSRSESELRLDHAQPGSYAFGFPRFLRIESPRISMRWALWTSRSRMPSASVGSPICSCHFETGSCEVRIVERT